MSILLYLMTVGSTNNIFIWLGVTYESLTSRPECLAEYESILQCASDGVDHSLCCRNNHVPDTCVGWCSNGGHVETDQVEICAITYSREIIG